MFTLISFSWKHKNAITFGILFCASLESTGSGTSASVCALGFICVLAICKLLSRYCSISVRVGFGDGGSFAQQDTRNLLNEGDFE